MRPSRRRLTEQGADLAARNERLIAERDAAFEEAGAAKAAARTGARQYVDVDEEHDVHRKALADALGEDKRNLGWDALIGEAGGLAASVADLTQRLLASEERARTAKTRADVESRPVDGASAVTATEARLRAELSRSEKARGALEEQCRVLQKANEVDARQLRALREGSKP